MARKLVYISIITSMIGSATIFALDLGFMQLSPYRICTLILFAYTILILGIAGNKIRMSKQRANYYSLIFMFIWVFYAIISVAWVKDIESWIRALFFLVFGLFIFFTYYIYLENKYDILKAFKVISIMILFHNAMGWYEIFTGNYFFLESDKMISYARASYPVSIFGNPNSFSTFMLLSVWVSYICYVNAKNRIVKITYIILTISSSLLLLPSNSRANLLGLILSVMIFVLISISNKKTRQALLLLLCAIFVIILLNPLVVGNFIQSVNEKLTFDFSNLSSSEGIRKNLIKNGLLFLVSTYGFGVGAGNIEYWMNHMPRYNTNGVLNIHNWWLEILVGYGAIIFVMYLVFYLKLFLSCYNKYKNSKDNIDKSISLGIMCFMVGYVVGAISSSSNISGEWLWVFWGIAVAYQGMNENKTFNQRKLI